MEHGCSSSIAHTRQSEDPLVRLGISADLFSDGPANQKAITEEYHLVRVTRTRVVNCFAALPQDPYERHAIRRQPADAPAGGEDDGGPCEGRRDRRDRSRGDGAPRGYDAIWREDIRS